MSFSALAHSLLPLRVALAPLASRVLTRLAGADARKFAQKLITNDIHLLTPQHATCCTPRVLAPQGRILHDVFLTARVEKPRCSSTTAPPPPSRSAPCCGATACAPTSPSTPVPTAASSRSSRATSRCRRCRSAPRRDPRHDALGYRFVARRRRPAAQLERRARRRRRRRSDARRRERSTTSIARVSACRATRSRLRTGVSPAVRGDARLFARHRLRQGLLRRPGADGTHALCRHDAQDARADHSRRLPPLMALRLVRGGRARLAV
jgi:hypothetical protein